MANNKHIEATNLSTNIYINYIYVYGCVKGVFQIIFYIRQGCLIAISLKVAGKSRAALYSTNKRYITRLWIRC